MTTNFFEGFDIGLTRGEVVLAPHSKCWATIYTLESARILEALASHLPQLKLHHMGSTAIKGIVAKPVIDILGEVDNINFVDEYEQIFKNLGYEYKGEYGIPGRRYLVLYGLNKQVAYVHMHLFESQSTEIEKHLKFRDLLNQNTELRLEYEAFKINLLKIGTPRSEYSNAKAEVIERILTIK